MGTIAKLLVHINTLNNHADKTILNIYIGWSGSESYWLFLYKTRIYPVSSTAVTQTICLPTSSVLGVQVTLTWNVIMPLDDLTFNFETLNGSNSRPRTMNVVIDLWNRLLNRKNGMCDDSISYIIWDALCWNQDFSKLLITGIRCEHCSNVS